MNLFEKLQSLNAPVPEAVETVVGPDPEPELEPEILQCACGSHLEGECPECDAEVESLTARLQAIGDRHEVNPPAPAEPAPAAPVVPAETASSKPPAPERPPAEEKKPLIREVCGICGKKTRTLSTHRCKGKDGTGTTRGKKILHSPALPPEPSETPPTDAHEPAQTPEVEASVPCPTSEEKGQEKPSEPPTEGKDEGKKEEASGPLFDVVFDALFEKADGLGLVRLETILDQIEKDLAKETKVPHWTLIEYNKGPGMLAALFEYWIKKVPPRGIVVLADSSSAGTRAVKDILRRYARTVIQGVR